MKHLGDITKIDGHKVPLVDIVTGGSPCQDLSVAGKRAGLDGERSGLFMEQIRIVKEMRDECRLRMRGADDNGRIIPRFMVWENVPGAFSSNKGEDFRCVLEEVCRVADKDATVPMPEKGKWSSSGCIMGDGYSVAWRVHDAQFWGVPQRRKRIALVADFGGASAPEILFERKSVSGDIEESGKAGEGAAATSEGDTNKTSGFNGWQSVTASMPIIKEGSPPIEATMPPYCCTIATKQMAQNINDKVANTLTSNDYKEPQAVCLNSWDVQSKHIQPEDGKAEALYSGECRGGGGESYVMQSKVYGMSAYESNAMKSSNPHSGIYEADTTRTLDNNGGNPACNQGGMIVLEGNGSRESHKGNGYKESETMYSLNTVEQHAVCVGNGQMCNITMKSVANGLDCMHDQQAVITYGLDRASFNQGNNAQYDFQVQEEIAQTIVAKGPGGVLTHK